MMLASWPLSSCLLLFLLFSAPASGQGTPNEANPILDNKNCTPELGKFLCKDGKQCLEATKVCDRVPQCSDGSDEFLDCDKPCTRTRCAHGCVPNLDSTKPGTCYCRKGYTISGTNRDRCTNINECEIWDSCSQLCEDNDGSHECSCLQGFRIGADNRTCSPTDPNVQVVYALKNSIRVWSSVDEKQFSVIENQGQTVGVAVDVKNGYVFWTDVSEGKEAIYRSKINGEGPVELIVGSGLALPEGIAFDWITGNIYFIDSNASHVVACTGNGAYCSVLVQEYMDKPREIALHPSHGLMFWTDWGDRASIIRAGMDGSSPLPIITSGLKWPNGLAVDHGNSRLYWTDAFYDQIETSSLTGQDRQVVIANGIHHPFSLDVFGDTLYWSDWHLIGIETCTKFTCKAPTSTIRDTLSGHPNGIAIFHPAAQPAIRTNPCLRAKCSHICVLAGSSYACLCPAGMILDRTKKICSDDDSLAQVLIGYENSLKTLKFNTIGRDVVEEKKLSDLKNIGAILYNPINDTIFISDLYWKTIFELNRKTNVMVSILTRHLDSVKSLALDVVGQNLYWGDSSRRKVEVMSLRTRARALITMEAEHPQDILVVPEKRYLFIVQTGRRGGRVLRMDMNGYNRRTLVRTQRGEPIALTYNAELGRIFWADALRETIEHMTTNGRAAPTLAVKYTGHPFSITSFDNRVFWSDSHTQLLHTFPVFGVDRNELPVFIGHSEDRNKTTHDSYISGNFLAKITVIHKDVSRYENLTRNHECSSSRKSPKCSHICLISGDLNVGTCVCPEGMQLDTNGLTCSWTPTCFGAQFQCSDKRCIDAEWQCDGFQDCASGEDELNCEEVRRCRSTDFTCEDDKTCVPANWKCDGESDCSDNSDEKNCGLKSCSSKSDFQCDNGHCIPQSWKCDHQFDCTDHSDEKSCNTTCPIGSFQCVGDLACIPTDWVCDGDVDCKDESDEHSHCDAGCTQNSFRCLNHHCIAKVLYCNGVADCNDNSDELDCDSLTSSTTLPPNRSFDNVEYDLELEVRSNGTDVGGPSVEPEPCPWNTFSCYTGECMEFRKVCDGTADCLDGSDEGPGCSKACDANQDCPHACYKTPQGSLCQCGRGFKPDEKDKRSCQDIDECLERRPCQHICTNTKGSYKCSCHEDYSLRSDQKRCKPIDKSVKTHLLHPQTFESSEESTHANKSTAATILSEESKSNDSASSGSTVGLVFGIIFLLIIIAAVVGFVLHRKRIHPKVLFERYGQQILVKFKPRPRQPRREPLGNEAIYDDVCDNGQTYTSSTYANPVYEDLDTDVNRNGDAGISKGGNSHSLADSGILTVMDTDPNNLYEDLDDHFVSYSQRDKLVDKEFV